MKGKISVSQMVDQRGRKVIRVVKSNGELTLKEIYNALNIFDFRQCSDFYAILMSCAKEEADLEDKGFDLLPVEECHGWKLNVISPEEIIDCLRDETEREIRKPTLTDSARIAWYWTFIGSVDMAFQLGLISDQKRQTFYDSVRHLKIIK